MEPLIAPLAPLPAREVRVADLPFTIPLEDKIRLKLRESFRELSLGNHQLDLPTIPGVQSLSLATRYIEGGRERFIELIQRAVLNGQSPEIARWWYVYADLMPVERERVSYDDVCAASGVRPSVLMAIVVSTAMEQNLEVADLVRASLHPQVLRAAAESAIRISGPDAAIAAEDRKQWLQRSGDYLPPRGTNIHVSASAQAAAASVNAGQDPSVPSFLDDVGDDLALARQIVQRRLQAAAVADVDGSGGTGE